jgi:hypothetical protein
MNMEKCSNHSLSEMLSSVAPFTIQLTITGLWEFTTCFNIKKKLRILRTRRDYAFTHYVFWQISGVKGHILQTYCSCETYPHTRYNVYRISPADWRGSLVNTLATVHSRGSTADDRARTWYACQFAKQMVS